MSRKTPDPVVAFISCTFWIAVLAMFFVTCGYADCKCDRNGLEFKKHEVHAP